MKTISTLPLAAALMGIAHSKFDDGGHGKIGDKAYSATGFGSGSSVTDKIGDKLNGDMDAEIDTTVGDSLKTAGLDPVGNQDRIRVPGTASSA